jgi:transcriptional antiterminator NusG
MQGVIGFIGGDRPVPISESEMDDIMAQTREEEDTAKPKVQFQAGETVTIRDGAFENFEGVIESVDPDRGKLRLSVSIFGRATPVEVEYWQVAHTT